MTIVILVAMLTLGAGTIPHRALGESCVHSIPILAVTGTPPHTGAVIYMCVSVSHRNHGSGMTIDYSGMAGRVTSIAQHSIEEAIRRTASALRVPVTSLAIAVTVPYRGVTVSGDSMSALIGLSVAALANGKHIARGISMTGTVGSDGRLLPAGQLLAKIAAAGSAKLHRVLMPIGSHVDGNRDHERGSPELIYVQSVDQAYSILTGDVEGTEKFIGSIAQDESPSQERSID